MAGKQPDNNHPTANGIAPAQIPAKFEGLAFSADAVDNGMLMYTLYVANDNDFVRASAGDNKFYVFGNSDADLSKAGTTYSAQRFGAEVPEPASPSSFCLGQPVHSYYALPSKIGLFVSCENSFAEP
jgi:hypothetical protein